MATNTTGEGLEWIEIPFGDGLRLGFWARWVESGSEEETMETEFER